MIRFAALLAFLTGASLVETDDFVYVSAITGTKANEVFAELTNRLKSAGLGLRQANRMLKNPLWAADKRE